MPLKAKLIVKKTKRTSRKPRISMVKQVNQIIARKQETKQSSTQYTASSFNGYINGSSDFVNIMPPIQIGTGDNNRVGATIQPVKMVIRGHICHNPSSFNVNPRIWGIRHFVLQDKAIRSVPALLSAGVNLNILDIGGVSTPFNGTILAYQSPPNKDQFMILRDKRYVMTKPYGITNSALTPMTSVDRSICHTFTVTFTQKQLPAFFKYDANSSSIYPTNFAPIMAVGYCDLTGNTIDTSDLSIVMAFTCTLYYKDS